MFKRRATDLRWRPPSMDREQALADLDPDLRWEREQVASCISAAEFRRIRDSKGLAELTRIKGECGAMA